MRWVTVVALAALTLATPGTGMAQRGGFGGRGGFGNGGFNDPFGQNRLQVPELPGPELDGPMRPDSASHALGLEAPDLARYTQAYDSFMVATKTPRDSARATSAVMYEHLDSGDRVAAVFYAERLQRLGKTLKTAQGKFESRLDRILSTDQVKAYRKWKDEEDQLAEDRRRDEVLRWRSPGFGGGRLAGGERGIGGGPPEEKVAVASPVIPGPDIGSQALRVGRSLLISAQLGVDSTGAIVGRGSLRSQAERAFANLTAVLAAARSEPDDVVHLTIYVVDYQPTTDLTTIRSAGAAYFQGVRQPITSVLGVERLSKEGALIAVEATAMASGGDSRLSRYPDRER